jgi:ATP synthase F1 delta subunit
MVKKSIAKKYALSFLSLVDRNDYQKVLDWADHFNEILIKMPQLLKYFENPAIPKAKKREIITTLSEKMNFEENFESFLKLIIENRRINIFDEIVKSIEEAIDSYSNVLKGVLITVKRVDPQKKARIEEDISSKVGKKIFLNEEIDPTILGGLRVKIGSLVFDGSFDCFFDEIEDYLLKGMKYGSA